MLLSGNKLSSGYKSVVLEADDISQIYIIHSSSETEESRDENRETTYLLSTANPTMTRVSAYRTNYYLVLGAANVRLLNIVARVVVVLIVKAIMWSSCFTRLAVTGSSKRQILRLLEICLSLFTLFHLSLFYASSLDLACMHLDRVRPSDVHEFSFIGST